MKKLLTILFLLPFFGMSQTTTFSLSQIPIGTDFLNADRGANLWINRDAPFGTIHIPTSGSPQEMMDYYYRFSWTHFFTGTGSDSTINWSFFRSKMSEATAKRMGIRFRVMANGKNIGNPPQDNFNNLQQYDGGWQNVPQFLHNLQQAESNAANRDFLSTFGGGYASWVPNTNSPQFQRWVRKFSQQLRNYIDTAVINGHPLRFAIRIYDLGFYGCFSEQHSACLCNQISDGNIPVGARHTAAGLNEIVDAQLDGLGGNPNWKYVIPFNALDAMWLPHTFNPVAYGQYLVDHPDSISWINDHIGADEGYDHSYWEDNNRLGSRAGTPRQTILNNRWRHSPTGGEPVGWGQPADRSAIPQYTTTYHFSFIGNGNLDHITNGHTTEANNFRLASRLAGYRLKVTGGSATVAGNLSISLNWINEGNAPVYFPWTVQYLIKNGSGSTVSTLTSSFQVRYFQPSGASNNITQAFTMPAIPVGSYGLYVRVVDANAYRNPMFLANTPRQADGSYFLGNITLGGGTNQSPIANAGPNQTIVPPDNDALLTSASSSDPDGTIVSRLWSQVSGPNTATNSTPTGTTTTVGNLIGGLYEFNVTVTDDDGATGFDRVQITVGGNQPPVANAGPNQATSNDFVTLNGTGSTDDVSIASYHWQKISGPVSFTLVTPDASTTVFDDLTAGTYIVRLTVVDGSGLSSFDDVQITVGSGNLPPIANAGANIVLTSPINFIQLNGSASSDDVGIVSYDWEKVGGPVTFSLFENPLSPLANFESLVTGIYIVRLTVCDVQGLCNSDDVQVTVLGAPTPLPVANAGSNLTITLPTNFVTLNGTGSTGTIFSYAWAKQSGPATFSMPFPTQVQPNVTNLVAGVYVFRLTVTNSSGSSFDDVTITVLPAPNQAPIANAGGSTSITLPTNSVAASGSGSTDADGTITAYLWTFISGPAVAGFTAATNVNTTINNLTVAGTYTIRLRVTDNSGATDTDDKIITVNAAANNSPVAIITGAGPTSMQLPTNSAAFTGITSTDDVGVTGYLWSQQSGPAAATISAPTSAATNFTNLVAGVYFFQLQVSDVGGLTDTDIIQVTVLAATPVRPILNGHLLIRTGVKFLPRHGHP